MVVNYLHVIWVKYNDLTTSPQMVVYVGNRLSTTLFQVGEILSITQISSPVIRMTSRFTCLPLGVTCVLLVPPLCYLYSTLMLPPVAPSLSPTRVATPPPPRGWEDCTKCGARVCAAYKKRDLFKWKRPIQWMKHKRIFCLVSMHEVYISLDTSVA